MRALLLTYVGLTLIVATDLLLFLNKDISLPGHLPDWLFFWTWLVMTVVVIFSNLKEEWSKVYGTMLILFAILTMLPMMIPFLTILAFATTPEDKRYRISDDMELQELQRFVVGRPTIVSIKSFGFYEKIVGQTESEIQLGDEFYKIEEAKSIRKLDNSGSDSLKIEFKFEGELLLKHCEGKRSCTQHGYINHMLVHFVITVSASKFIYQRLILNRFLWRIRFIY